MAGVMKMDKAGIKGDFPVFGAYPELVYLDNAATVQKPFSVLEAVKRYYREDNANPLRGLYELSVRATETYESARETVRRFIGAGSSREIVFTRNATESLNLIAYSFGREGISEGDEILVAISEHHSDLLPWQFLAREKGAARRENRDKRPHATARHIRLSPRKAGIVLDLIRGKRTYGGKANIKKFLDGLILEAESL